MSPAPKPPKRPEPRDEARGKLAKHRKEWPLEQEEVRWILESVPMDPQYETDPPGGREWPNALLAYNRAVKAFREMPLPHNVTNPLWCVRGAAVLEAARDVALRRADLSGSRDSPLPRLRGVAPDPGRRWRMLVVGFLKKSKSARYACRAVAGTPPPDFQVWADDELRALRDAWNLHPVLGDRFPWRESAKSTKQAAVRGDLEGFDSTPGFRLLPDNKHSFPSVEELLKIIEEFPDPNVAD